MSSGEIIKEFIGNLKLLVLIKPIEQGRLLIISPFGREVKRASEKTAAISNQLMISLADCITWAMQSQAVSWIDLSVSVQNKLTIYINE